MDDTLSPWAARSTLDAVGDAGALGFEGEELTVEVAGILGHGGGHVHDGPDVRLAVVVADEHGEQLGGVDAIGLDAPAAAFHVDGGGVDDEVVAPGLGGEEAVDPEAVAAGLVAGEEGPRVVQVEASARPRAISRRRASRSPAGMERSLGFWPRPVEKASFQERLEKLEGEIENGRLGQVDESAGRRGHDGTSVRNGRSAEGQLAAARARSVKGVELQGHHPPPA